MCFNPRPSCEGRPTDYESHGLYRKFQSTPLMRGATRARVAATLGKSSFNPRPSCEGRLDALCHPAAPLRVSIHAPHARGDRRLTVKKTRFAVSIHAPHARGDQWPRGSRRARCRFNPRPSCEGRPSRHCCPPCSRSFNPRPSCEGRPETASRSGWPQLVSIHAPHARGDASLRCPLLPYRSFQSTPLMRGATRRGRGGQRPAQVSIHAPHARGDRRCARSAAWGASFNPRPSCEGRQHIPRPAVGDALVSIHAPHARGDVVCVDIERLSRGVSIHAPHARGDVRGRRDIERPFVSIHAPHARGDTFPSSAHPAIPSFNPRPSCEGRPDYWGSYAAGAEFQSTPLMRGATP